MRGHLLAGWGMAFFLAVMAGMNAWNCWLLWREKQVKGISPLTVLFRSGANIWQVWFLFQLGQWAAFGVSVPATGLNLGWVLMAFYYQRWPGGCQYLLDAEGPRGKIQPTFSRGLHPNRSRAQHHHLSVRDFAEKVTSGRR